MLPNQPALLDETDRKLYTLLALRSWAAARIRSFCISCLKTIS